MKVQVNRIITAPAGIWQRLVTKSNLKGRGYFWYRVIKKQGWNHSNCEQCKISYCVPAHACISWLWYANFKIVCYLNTKQLPCKHPVTRQRKPKVCRNVGHAYIFVQVCMSGNWTVLSCFSHTLKNQTIICADPFKIFHWMTAASLAVKTYTRQCPNNNLVVRWYLTLHWSRLHRELLTTSWQSVHKVIFYCMWFANGLWTQTVLVASCLEASMEACSNCSIRKHAQ